MVFGFSVPQSPQIRKSPFLVKDKIKFLILLVLRVHHWMDALDQGPAGTVSPTGSVTDNCACANSPGLAVPGFLPRQALPACVL